MAAEAQAVLQEPPGGPPATAAAPTALAGGAEPPVAAAAKETKRSKATKGPSKAAKGSAKSTKSDAGSTRSESPSVAAHPRAARSVAQAKGWGGLAGFLIAGYFSLPTATLAEAGLHALVAGSVCYVAAWAAAVFVWRRLVAIEIKGREQRLLARAQMAGGTDEAALAQVEHSRAGGSAKGP